MQLLQPLLLHFSLMSYLISLVEVLDHFGGMLQTVSKLCHLWHKVYLFIYLFIYQYIYTGYANYSDMYSTLAPS